MKRACVIGWPISHSRSPLIHNHWLKTMRIAGTYSREPVEPRDLPTFIGSLEASGFQGCNVTLPHKEEAFKLVTIADDTTAAIGAVNTIYRSDGKTFGTSTDGEGFLANLTAGAPRLVLSNRRVVVLGAGGAALSICGALLNAGVAEVSVVNRTIERAQSLRERFGPRIKPTNWADRNECLRDSSLLVNTTSLGMKDQPALDISLTRLPSDAVVTDIVYVPLLTPMLALASSQGYCTVDGLGMLLHQAVRGFHLWFGQKPQVTQGLYDLVARDIDPGYRR